MGKEAPPAPDYASAAQATAEGSRKVTEQQTWANRPDQLTPWGETKWENTPTYDPTTKQTLNRWTQTQTLSPDAQGALDSQLSLTRGRSDLAGGMMGRVADEFGGQMDWEQFGGQAKGVNAEAIDMGDLPPGAATINAQTYNAPSLQRGLDYSDASEVGDTGGYVNRAEDALYDRRTSRLDPIFNQRSEALDVKLRNQGLTPGDQAYDAAMGNFTRERTDAYETAQNEAIMKGGAEASRMFGMDVTRRGMDVGETDAMAGFYNQAAGQQAGLDMATGGQTFAEATGAATFQNMSRQQALAEQIRVKDRGYAQGNQAADRQNTLRTQKINEELQKRGTSLNEMNALISGQQVQTPNMPTISLAGRAQGPDMLRAAEGEYSAALDRTNAANMGTQGLMSGAASLAGMFSDRRLKKNIIKVGAYLGYPVYIFQYLWDTWAVGVMSDEINQDAVFKHPSGYDMVDYGRIA